MKLFKSIAISLMLLATLSACSGGGGSAGSTAVSGTDTGGSGGTTGVGGTTTVVLSTPTMVVSIVNSSGAIVSSISIGGGFKVSALLRDGSGTPIQGKLVTFNLNGSTLAAVAPATALTNASGIAVTNLSPTAVSSVGAAKISAGADVNSVAVSGNIDFAVSATNITLAPLTANSLSLPSAGGAQLSTTALIGGVPASGIAVNVVFSASCGRINGQDASAGVSVTANGAGAASAAYEAISVTGELCSGPVSVTASSTGAPVQTLALTVAPPTANAITYVGANPAKIFVAGSGAFEQSIVKFKVLSSAGTPLSGVNVTFSIVTNPGGIGLNATGSTANVSVVSNSAGEVSTSIFSGTIPGPVKLKAALASNPSVFAESQNLTVASGPPSQRFMSLSVDTFNIEGWNIDGSSTRLTARIADRQGNAVEDGTVVNFTAEAGQVAVSCATTRVNGLSQCSVDFQSQNPRPAGGRVSVMAYLAGTKDYVDVNGNNKYDSAIDSLIPIGNAYRDDNENGVFDSGEFIVPRGGTESCAGSGAPFPSASNTCDSSLETTVRQQVAILYSSSSPNFSLPQFSTQSVLVTTPAGTITATLYSGIDLSIGSAVNNLLPMPAGTTVTAEAAGGQCTVDKQFGSPVPNVNPTNNPSQNLRTGFSVFLKTCFSGDTVFVTVKSPGGLATILPIRLP
jgi:hypothetical protein